MAKYIDADEFVSLKREWYCNQCEKRKGMKRGRLQFVYEIGGPPCRACDVDDMISDIEDFPAADVEPKQRWIPVTEPPKMEGEYWVYYQSGAMGSMNYDDENGWGRWYDNGIYESWDPHDGVRYWMPLPEPPKGEDDERCRLTSETA